MMQDPFRFEKVHLQNGIPAYLNLNLPVHGVLLAVVLPVGSRDDPPGKEGCAHFLEHLVFKGTTRFPDKIAIALPIERCGGAIEAYTSTERTVLYTWTLPKDINMAAAALYEVTSSALNRKMDFSKERGVILAELNESTESASWFASKVLREQLFEKHPLAHLVIGERDSIASLTVTDVRRFYDRHIRNGAYAVFAIGRAHTFHVLRCIEKAFGAKQTMPDTRKRAHPPFSTSHHARINNTAYAQSCIALGARIFPVCQQKLMVALNVFGAMLYRGMSSPLSMALREPKRGEGLVYDFDVYYNGHSDAGLLEFMAMTDYENIDRVVDAFFETLERVVRDAKRFAIAKTMLTNEERLNLWSPPEILDAAAESVIEGGHDPVPLRTYIERVRRMSLDEIGALAREYMPRQTFSSVVVKGSAV